MDLQPLTPSEKHRAKAASTFSRIDAVEAPRFPRRFRTRVFTYIAFLSLTTAVASAGIYYWRQLGFIKIDRTRRARTLLTSLATETELGAYAGDVALCELSARRTFTEEDVALVAVYDRRGREILHFSSPRMVPPLPPADTMRRLLSNPDAPPEAYPREEFDDLYAPIVTATRDPAEAIATGPSGPPPRREVVGVARVGLSLKPARQQLNEMLTWGAYLAVALLMVGLAAALLISRLVSRPIAALTRGAERIRAGMLDTRVPISSTDELGQLAYAFNRMASRLAETMTALETLNRDLEAEVARRTVAIQRAAQFTALLNAPVAEGGDTSLFEVATRATGGDAVGTLARLLDAALTSLANALPSRGAAAYLTREESVDFDLEAAWALGAPVPEFGEPPPEDDILKGEPRWDGKRLLVPLRIGDQPEGCLLFLLDEPPSEDQVQFAHHAATQLAIAVSNVRAYAVLDHLARELTERNSALAKQRDQLQEMNRLKSEFLANTSHELRTPLNAIIGYAELIADGIYGPISDGQKSALDGIDESGKNLLQLINQILDLAKVEAGKMQVHLEVIDLVEVARSVITETAPLVKSRPYQVGLAGDAHAPMRTDAAKVKQILINLISNAVKFTNEGEVVVSVKTDQTGAILAVRDTGIGIKPEDQRVIFEEFRQVDGSYTRQYGGTGLGLSIARRLSELLGGTISVESQYGKGSTFTVRLPFEREAPQTDRVTRPMRRVTLPPPIPRDVQRKPG